MRKIYAIAMVVVLVGTWTVGAIAQAAQAAPSNQSAAGQQQMTDDTVSADVRAKLSKGIGHALLMLPYYGVYDWITAYLKGRTVTLEGQVLRSSLKPDAERAVKKVEGIDNVVNNIQVLLPGPLDDRVRRAVYQAIYAYGPLFKYSNDKLNPPIHILVSNARVTLEGAVNTETDKGLCTMRANQVPGVISVTNNLRVIKS